MAEVPPIPKTLREAVIAIWYKINNGMSKELGENNALAKETASRLQKIEAVVPTLWTHEQHLKMHADYVAAEEQKAEKKAKEKQEAGRHEKLTRREKIMLWLVGIATFSGMLFGFLGLVF